MKAQTRNNSSQQEVSLTDEHGRLLTFGQNELNDVNPEEDLQQDDYQEANNNSLAQFSNAMFSPIGQGQKKIEFLVQPNFDDSRI